MLIEHVAQLADRGAQLGPADGGRSAEGGQGPTGPELRRLDRLMVIGERCQVDALLGGGRDERPEDAGLVLMMGADLGEQRCRVAADRVRLSRRHAMARDLAEPPGKPRQVLADRAVHHDDGCEVGLGIGRSPGGKGEGRCAWHAPSVRRRAGG